ncbi:hypothetical protein Zm00014a_003862 [Zea mays]|uniref:Uncharacterized protein n=1 Tax=Zea mays TaxID=4577 RepID=A0A3L6F6J0_MAIZE|nr:hypothetical protein Zm00014a_003862 [Zea mays]
MAVNWELQGCCHRDQRIFIAVVGVSTVVILLLRTFLLKPFKLITVFLHETSHALACKLTCGDLRTFLLKPFKLITVFLHETSHALACKLTCGDGVSSMVRYAELRLMATFQAASSELEWCQKCLLLLLPQFDPAIEMMTAFWTANLKLTTYPKYLPLLHVDHMKVAPITQVDLSFLSEVGATRAAVEAGYVPNDLQGCLYLILL